MTDCEKIVRAVLTMHANPFFVSDTEYQRDRVVEIAIRTAQPIFDEAVRKSAAAVVQNAS